MKCLHLILLFLVLLSPLIAEARVHDVTPPETKAYCKRNPDKCSTTIIPTGLLMLAGIPLFKVLPHILKPKPYNSNK